MASSRGWPTRAVSSLWTAVMLGLVSPEPKIAIRRGGRVSWPSTPEMLRRSYARLRGHDQVGVLHHPPARDEPRGVLPLLARCPRPGRTADSRAAAPRSEPSGAPSDGPVAAAVRRHGRALVR